MISKTVEKAINDQIVVEGYSSNLYLAMASWCEVNGFAGASGFLSQHADEERMHMLKFIHYLNDREGIATIPSFKAPPKDYKDIYAVFGEIMKHEVYVTDCINNLVEAATKAKDFNTVNFLQWYVMEQIEEESLFRNILDKIKLLGKEKTGFYLIDKELEGMTTPPAAAGK